MSNSEQPRGIPRKPGDAASEAEEARKSELLLRAQLLRQASDDEGAAAEFARAAEIEERLSESCRTRGLPEKALVHQFSAASCWAQAGNFFRAIALCEALRVDSAASPELRDRAAEYAESLRARRSAWYQGLVSQTAGAET